MIKVNLFPFRAARIKENIRRQVTIYALSVIFLLLASSYFYLDINNKVKTLRKEQDVKQKELDSFKDTNVKIAALKKTIAEVEVKLKTIKRLEKGKTGPVRLLDDIATSVPEDKLWLTTLKEQNTKSINSVQLVRTRQKKMQGFDLSLKDFSLNAKTYAFKKETLPKAGKKN
jgi:type IV pilus assembly protein PilN